MRSLPGPWTLACCLFFTAQAAFAEARPYPECTKEPTENDIAAAKGAFQAGQASFNEADYERAITYWEDAYRRDCTAHALLLNLARAYELGGDKPQAVEALQTYLARKPESPQKDQINRRIEVLNQQIQEEAEAAPPPAPPAQPAAPAAAVATEQKPAAPNEAPLDQQESSNYWLGPVILGSAGVIASGTGIVVHIIGSSDEQKAEDACPTRADCPPAIKQLGNDGIFKQKLGVGLMIGGGAAMAGSVIWYLLARPDAEPQGQPRSETAPAATDVSATPANSPKSSWLMLPELGQGYAGLSVAGSF